MTPEEAIKIAIHCLGVQAEREVCEECDIYSNCHTDCKDAAGVAIEALKEVQQYLEIGTMEQLKNQKENLNVAYQIISDYEQYGTVEEFKMAQRYMRLVNAHGTIGQVIDSCAEYEEIGTVEECREAVEKQTPKAPDYEGDGYDNKGELIYDTWICPNCGERYELDYDDYEHCPKCGQAIRQSENLEGTEDEH